MDNEDKIKLFLRNLLGEDINDTEINKKVEELKKLAFEEWVEWITGSYRPNSISENITDRIFKIYIFLKEDIPKIEELVNYFNIPSGRARYIISVMKYGGHPKLKELSRKKLKSLLEEAIKGKEEHETITPFIEKALLDELAFIEHEILHKDENSEYERYKELEGRRSFGLECSMTVKSAKLIIDKIRQLIGET